MKSNIILFHLLFFLLSSPFIRAQSYYQKGIIFLNNNDTLYGQLKRKNHFSIELKNETDSRIFLAKDVKKCIIGVDEYIVSKTFYMDESVDKQNVNFNATIQKKYDFILLRALVVGSKSLFECTFEEYGKQFFIMNDDNEIELLEHKYYQTNKNSAVYTSEINYYKEKIKQYLNNFQLPENEIKYNEKSLKGLFFKYYKSKELPISFISIQKKPKLSYGITAGYSRTKINALGRTTYEYLTDINYIPSYNVSFGGLFELNFPYKNYKWSLRNELLYTRLNSYHEYSTPENNSYYVNHKVTLDFTYFKLFSLAQYNIPLNKVSNFNLYLGVANGFAFQTINKDDFTYYFQTTPYQKNVKAVDAIERYSQSITFGFGYKYRKIELKLLHERSTGLSAIPSIALFTKHYYLLSSYYF